MTNIRENQTNEVKASNDLRHTATRIVGKEKIVVKIRLNDECKNGHQEFAITADIYEKKGNAQFYWDSGSCQPDEILKYFPQFKLFVDLHLSDYLGTPMYAVGNGFYHLKNSDKQTVLNYLRIDEDTYNKLYLVDDEAHFKYLLYSLGIVDVWKEEAKKGIELMEELTGTQFINDSKRSQIELLTDEEKTIIKSRLKDSYYTIDAINLRKEEAKQAKKNKQILDLQETFIEGKTKLENSFKVNMFILENDYPIDNFIYYNHSNEAVFNVWDSNFRLRITEEQFNEFIKLDFSSLPKDIVFKLGKGK